MDDFYLFLKFINKKLIEYYYKVNIEEEKERLDNEMKIIRNENN